MSFSLTIKVLLVSGIMSMVVLDASMEDGGLAVNRKRGGGNRPTPPPLTCPAGESVCLDNSVIRLCCVPGRCNKEDDNCIPYKAGDLTFTQEENNCPGFTYCRNQGHSKAGCIYQLEVCQGKHGPTVCQSQLDYCRDHPVKGSDSSQSTQDKCNNEFETCQMNQKSK